MNDIIKLVCRFKEEKEEEIFYILVDKLRYLFKDYLKKCSSILKDDLYQLFLLEVYDNVVKFNLDYTIIDKYILNGDNRFDYLRFPFIGNFIKKYKNIGRQEDFINEYIFFANQNQFIHCLKKRLKYTFIDFQKSKYYKETVEKVSLNSLNDNGQELIGIIEDKKKLNLNYEGIDDEDRNFLLLFIDNGKLLTEKEVSKILNISQQAVNKKKNKILKKYKK